MKRLRRIVKSNGEAIGSTLLVVGAIVLFTLFYLVACRGLRNELGLFGAALGILSLGLGFLAIGMSAKSDIRHRELLTSLRRDVRILPAFMKNDKFSLPNWPLEEEAIQEVVISEPSKSEQSKEAAQKRLDEDTQKVGLVRGEVYEVEEGRWGIHWGGKWPL